MSGRRGERASHDELRTAIGDTPDIREDREGHTVLHGRYRVSFVHAVSYLPSPLSLFTFDAI